MRTIVKPIKFIKVLNTGKMCYRKNDAMNNIYVVEVMLDRRTKALSTLLC